MKKILPLLVLVLVVAAGFFVYRVHEEKEFVANSRDLVADITQVSLLAETVNGFYYTIWRNAVYKEKSYSFAGKYQYKDFNEALLIAKDDMKSSVDSIDSNSKRIGAKIKFLNNPPTKYENVHGSIIRLFGLFNELSELAQSPQGSLLTFGAKTTELSTGILNVSKEIEALLPAE